MVRTKDSSLIQGIVREIGGRGWISPTRLHEQVLINLQQPDFYHCWFVDSMH